MKQTVYAKIVKVFEINRQFFLKNRFFEGIITRNTFFEENITLLFPPIYIIYINQKHILKIPFAKLC